MPARALALLLQRTLWADFGIASSIELYADDVMYWLRTKSALDQRGKPGQKLSRPAQPIDESTQ